MRQNHSLFDCGSDHHSPFDTVANSHSTRSGRSENPFARVPPSSALRHGLGSDADPELLAIVGHGARSPPLPGTYISYLPAYSDPCSLCRSPPSPLKMVSLSTATLVGFILETLFYGVFLVIFGISANLQWRRHRQAPPTWGDKLVVAFSILLCLLITTVRTCRIRSSA